MNVLHSYYIAYTVNKGSDWIMLYIAITDHFKDVLIGINSCPADRFGTLLLLPHSFIVITYYKSIQTKKIWVYKHSQS